MARGGCRSRRRSWPQLGLALDHPGVPSEVEAPAAEALDFARDERKLSGKPHPRHRRPDPRADRPRPGHRQPLVRPPGLRHRRRRRRARRPRDPHRRPGRPPHPARRRPHRRRDRRPDARRGRGALPCDAAILVAAVADWKVEASRPSSRRTPARPSCASPQPRHPRDARHPSARPRLLVGFAAETDDLLANAAAKRTAKGADWIVANDVSGDVMGGASNHLHLLTADGVRGPREPAPRKRSPAPSSPASPRNLA
jgi:hypothetical protein